MQSRDSAHAEKLFHAICVALSAYGCGAETKPPPVDIVAAPLPSTQASASTSPNESSVPTALLPPPQPSASKPRRRRSVNVEGRPFLVDGAARLAALSEGYDWADDVAIEESDPQKRDVLIEHYTQWSLAEHASIASFARFALQLLALGAPSDLVARATSAMADEIRHARFGFGLVRALSHESVAPGPLAIDHALDDSVTLESVLRLAVREGMIGETLAALEVRAAADLADEPSLRAALHVIADEESKHAELAYAFGAWAIGQAPELARVIEDEVCDWTPPTLPASAGLDRFGTLETARRQAVRDNGLEKVVRALVSLVAA